MLIHLNTVLGGWYVVGVTLTSGLVMKQLRCNTVAAVILLGLGLSMTAVIIRQLALNVRALRSVSGKEIDLERTSDREEILR